MASGADAAGFASECAGHGLRTVRLGSDEVRPA